jgi:hypothetical protein
VLFSSADSIRSLAARWVGLETWVHGRSLLLDTASLSAVGYDGEGCPSGDPAVERHESHSLFQIKDINGYATRDGTTVAGGG